MSADLTTIDPTPVSALRMDPADTLPIDREVEPAAKLPGNVVAALIRAQAAVKLAAKDATNEFHHYSYASAESIKTEAKRALESCGLAILPTGHRLRVNESHYELEQAFILAHESGDYLRFSFPWPVIPEKGRPIDKAMAGALTTSLSYFLIGLLQIPRGGEEVDQRDDTQHAEKEYATKAQHDEIQRMLRLLSIKTSEYVKASWERLNVDPNEFTPAEADAEITRLRSVVKLATAGGTKAAEPAKANGDGHAPADETPDPAGPMNRRQWERLHELIKMAGLEKNRYYESVRDRFGVRETRQLTWAQAERETERLEREIEEQMGLAGKAS